jgi:photosystem II stability/assembly factor-like uncharacterized protein
MSVLAMLPSWWTRPAHGLPAACLTAACALAAAAATVTTAGAAPADGPPPTKGPPATGSEARRLTPIDADEWRIEEPVYRWTLARIAAGLADKPTMRLHWYLRQRLSPGDGPFPADWRALVAPRWRGGEAPAGNDAATLPATGRWIPIGPATFPGRVTGLAALPGAPGALAAALADGGVFLTRDEGLHWEPVTDREIVAASGSMLAHPTDARTLFWGTGEPYQNIDAYQGIGVLRSHDGGRTWLASNEFSKTVGCLVSHPATPGTIWACGQSGVYRSTDGGASFSWLENLTTYQRAVSIELHPTDPAVVYATFDGGAVWRTVDGGGSWTQLTNGLPADLYRAQLAICPADPARLLLAGDRGDGELWRSLDAGESWSRVSAAPGHCPRMCWYANDVAFAPDDCETIYLGGVDGYVSRDGGASFALIPADYGSHADPSRVHVDWHAIVTRPGGRVYAGTDGGVFASADYGASWRTIGQGLPGTQFYGVCGHDLEPGRLLGGTQDNGSLRRRDADGWRWVLGGDGGFCALAGERVLGEYQWGNLQRSLDGGASFADANAGIPSTDSKLWIAPLVRDPSQGATYYVSSDRVYRTTDFHETPWVQIRDVYPAGRMPSALAVSPADRNVLWVGYDQGGLFVSQNALAAAPTWKNAGLLLPVRNVRQLTPHPTLRQTAWVVFAGFGNPRIGRTDNLGTNWTDVTGDLPDLPVNDLVVDPGDPAVLFVATDLGVYRSADGGTHWASISDGLPPSAVVQLIRHPASGKLIAATHGRGMFTLRALAPGATAVPDGRVVAGTPLRAERTADERLWLRWDTEACTAARYHLFWGPLDAVASGVHAGATCDLGRGGETVVRLPGTAGESAYFLVAAASASGVEGPHGYDSGGAVRPHSGVGWCGVTSRQPAASCP